MAVRIGSLVRSLLAVRCDATHTACMTDETTLVSCELRRGIAQPLTGNDRRPVNRRSRATKRTMLQECLPVGRTQHGRDRHVHQGRGNLRIGPVDASHGVGGKCETQNSRLAEMGLVTQRQGGGTDTRLCVGERGGALFARPLLLECLDPLDQRADRCAAAPLRRFAFARFLML